MVSKSTMSYNGHQIFGLAQLSFKDIYYVGSFLADWLWQNHFEDNNVFSMYILHFQNITDS